MTPADGIVYVIDDDPSLRRALARLVEGAGFDVETFPSAEAFLGHPVGDRPACLVLDVRLPGDSGLELQATLGSARRLLPIIFLTGHGTVSAGIRAMKRGAVDFLEKPVDENELLDGIREALRQSRDARDAMTEEAEVERRLGSLTAREREVLDLVVAGMLNKQIGERLGVAEKTIKVHRGRVMQKMAAASVADLVRMVHKLGRGPARTLPAERRWDRGPVADGRRVPAE